MSVNSAVTPIVSFGKQIRAEAKVRDRPISHQLGYLGTASFVPCEGLLTRAAGGSGK